MKFTGVCLITKNVPALVDFYSRVLGVASEGDDTHVEDVDAEYERLKPLGVVFVKPPQTHPWGSRSF